MRPTLVLLTVLAAAPAAAGPASAPTSWSAAGRRAAIDAALARLEVLSKRAQVDVRLDRIRTYRAMNPTQLGDAKKAIDLEEILDVMKDDGAPPEIREAAADALTWDQALRNDPKLDLNGRGLKRPRAAFTLKVLPLLTDGNDLVGRGLAKRVCEAWWPNVKEPAVLACDARKRESCRAARAAWEAALRR